MTEVMNDPAVARRRRKAIIQSQRSETTAEPPAPAPTTATAGAGSSGSEEEDEPTKRKAPAEKTDEERSKKSKVAKQIKYNPDVPMSKEQLAAWRREARRVRNRESAAASRQRIRNRITELEDEVADWKSKYVEAMERLKMLEKTTSKPSNNTDSAET